MEAIGHFKNKGGAITDKAPTCFLDKDECQAVTASDDGFRPSLYKVFLFQHVAASIKSGHLNIYQSYKHRSFDSYMIGKPRWERDKLKLIDRTNLMEFIDPKPILATLEKALFQQYQETNANIASNPYLTIRSDGSFHIKTPPLDEQELDPLQALFPERQDVPLAQVLDTVDRHCDMLKAFAHWQQTHTPVAVSRPALLASIMGLGCGIGIRKMARISSRMTESELEHTVNWRFSLDVLVKGGQYVTFLMSKGFPGITPHSRKLMNTRIMTPHFQIQGQAAGNKTCCFI